MDLYTLNVESGAVAWVSSPDGVVLYPAWSLDGSSIAFCLEDYEEVQIYKVSIDGSNLEQLTSGVSFSCYPEWR